MAGEAGDGGVAEGIQVNGGLLRRVAACQCVDDSNSGGKRPSSAAFKDPELSVDAEEILIEDGKDFNFSVEGFPTHALVRFPAAEARTLGLPVLHSPIDGNRAHTEVHGKKTQSIANKLAAAAEWVVKRW